MDILGAPTVNDVESFSVGSYTAMLITATPKNQAYVLSLVDRALPELTTTTAGTFKERYILGVGFPHVPIGEQGLLCLFKTPFLKPAELIPFAWPKELDLSSLPMYRVVLEKVDP